MYAKNSASPPTIFVRVVHATTSAGITSGVVCYHIQADGTRTATTNSPSHVSGGLWRFTPTQAETNYDEFAIEFYHADAVGGGPVVGIVTTAVSADSNKPEVDLASVGGNAAAANSLEAMLNASPVNTVNDATPTATSFTTDLVEASNGHYNDSFLLFTEGALAGQARRISDYDGASKTVTVINDRDIGSGFTEAPANGDKFVILGRST